MMQYRISTGFTPSIFVKGKIGEAFAFPLLFEPGEAWSYSVGIDWAGWMVERVSGITLEEYIQKNVLAPVGASLFAFYPKRNPEVISKLTDMSVRLGGPNMFGTPADPNGKLDHTDDTVWNPETDGCAGGAGGYGAPLDYQKVLNSLCADDEKLLTKATTAEMFKPTT